MLVWVACGRSVMRAMECSSLRLAEGRRYHRPKRCSISRLNARPLMSIAICAIPDGLISAARVQLENWGETSKFRIELKQPRQFSQSGNCVVLNVTQRFSVAPKQTIHLRGQDRA